MTGYVADLSWKSGARAIEKLDRLRSTMAVNVLNLQTKLRHSQKTIKWTFTTTMMFNCHKVVTRVRKWHLKYCCLENILLNDFLPEHINQDIFSLSFVILYRPICHI